MHRRTNTYTIHTYTYTYIQTCIHDTDITQKIMCLVLGEREEAEREKPDQSPHTGVQHRLALRDLDARTRREVYICMYNTCTQLHVCCI
jgi:hypothetical protein